MLGQDAVVMPDDLGSGQRLAVPGAVAVADQNNVEAEAARAPARRVDADLGLRAGDDQAADADRRQFGQQGGVVKCVRRLFGVPSMIDSLEVEVLYPA